MQKLNFLEFIALAIATLFFTSLRVWGSSDPASVTVTTKWLDNNWIGCADCTKAAMDQEKKYLAAKNNKNYEKALDLAIYSYAKGWMETKLGSEAWNDQNYQAVKDHYNKALQYANAAIAAERGPHPVGYGKEEWKPKHIKEIAEKNLRSVKGFLNSKKKKASKKRDSVEISPAPKEPEGVNFKPEEVNFDQTEPEQVVPTPIR